MPEDFHRGVVVVPELAEELRAEAAVMRVRSKLAPLTRDEVEALVVLVALLVPVEELVAPARAKRKADRIARAESAVRRRPDRVQAESKDRGLHAAGVVWLRRGAGRGPLRR